MPRRSRYRDAKLVTVTPAMATAWRATGTPTQKVDQAKVAALVEAMRAGVWDVDLHRNQPVKLSSDEQLQNGNHRCQAVIEYGQAVQLWVWRNP
jgi:hypothetical protein